MDKGMDIGLETIEYEKELFYQFHHNFASGNYHSHWHDAVEIIMPLENGCKVKLSEMSYQLDDYDIIIIPSCEPHEILLPEKGRRIILQFDMRVFTLHGLSDAAHVYAFHRMITPQDSPELHDSIKSILLEMLEEYLTRSAYCEVSIASKIIPLTLLLARQPREEHSDDDDNMHRRKEKLARFSYCIDYIHRSYMDNLSLELVAEAVNFSKYHFSRWFQQFAGVTFNDYLTRYRLGKAEAILLSSAKSVTQIALDVGFQSTTTFNRIFKERNHCTPTEYRQFHHKYAKQYERTLMRRDDPGAKHAVYIKTAISPCNPMNSASRVNGGMFSNPLLWADVPDPSVIRVGDCYYMTSTTMYYTPGCPIMRSSDLINWEIVNYAYDILDDSDANCLRNDQSAYGKGSWASSLRFSNGIFYIAVGSFTTGKTYIFQTDDIESGPWHRHTLDRMYHDPSLFFDDDGRVFLIYDSGTIRVIELTSDATAVKPGGLDAVLIEKTDAGGTGGLPAEGSHFHKINGKYYLFLIAWPPAQSSASGSGRRIQLCYRADSFEGPYEGKVVLDDGLVRQRDGVAQGGIVDTPDGSWYAMLFQDHGPVGRLPVLVSLTWDDGWPQLGSGGCVPYRMPLPSQGSSYEAAKLIRQPVNNRQLSEDDAFGHRLAGGSSHPITISDEFYLKPGLRKSFTAQSDISYSYTRISPHEPGVADMVVSQNAEVIANGYFIEGMKSWNHREIAKLSIVNDTAIHDRPVLLVDRRATTGSGPMQDITGKLYHGGVYEVSARVKFTDGPEQKDFIISIDKGGGWESIENMAFGCVAKGEWGIIRGIYTFPFDADLSETTMFIETPWVGKPKKETDLLDYYVEYVSITEKPLHTLVHTLPGENDAAGSYLSLHWQFNHNPDHNHWTLLERPGFLRLKSAYLRQGLVDARNTLTQRTFGPVCAGAAAIETQGLRDGDTAGLAALQDDYGYVGVRQANGKQFVVMMNAASGEAKVIETVPLDAQTVRVYLKLDFDFYADTAYFYYSLDGLRWQMVGNILPLTYKLTHFTGYRFALFYFSTQIIGGHADFDYFRVSDSIMQHNGSLAILNASLGRHIEANGLDGTRFKVPLTMDALPDDAYDAIHFSMCIPPLLLLEDVLLCCENITGDVSHICKDGRLRISVTGGDVHFRHNVSDLFAVLHFSVNGFVTENTTLTLRPDYLHIEGGNAAYDMHNAFTVVTLTYVELGAKAKKPGYANPLISHRLGADPCVLVHNERVYMYLTGDVFEYDSWGRLISNTFGHISSIRVISSEDLLNWTDHGEIRVTGVDGLTHWAVNARQPAVVSKTTDGREMFYMYFSNDTSNIGVLMAESPLGPWEDVLGQPLIHRGLPGVSDVKWCFDPAVLIDDGGAAYMYFGGGLPTHADKDALHPKTARVIRLGDDMVSTRGEAIPIDAPAFYEASGINKIFGKYYYSYCSNFDGHYLRQRPKGYPGHGEIAYMVGDSPNGPFEYMGVLLENPIQAFGDGGNNSHCIFEFKDEWFIAYHTQTLSSALDRAKGYRSPHINRLRFYGDGRILQVAADREGVVLPGGVCPYSDNPAYAFAWQAGIKTAENNAGMYVTHIHTGDWMAVANVDFGNNGAGRFEAQFASSIGGEVEIWLDSPQGEYIGSLAVGILDSNGTWEMRSCEVTPASGIRHVFFMFKGDSENSLFDFRSWRFS